MQGMWVQSLVGELRSHMPHGVAKKKKALKETEENKIEQNRLSQPGRKRSGCQLGEVDRYHRR